MFEVNEVKLSGAVFAVDDLTFKMVSIAPSEMARSAVMQRCICSYSDDIHFDQRPTKAGQQVTVIAKLAGVSDDGELLLLVDNVINHAEQTTGIRCRS